MENEKGWNRRDFLKMSLAAGTVAALQTPSLASSGFHQVSLRDCLEMSPSDMADKSEAAQKAYKFILETVNTIRDNNIRTIVLGSIKNPTPTLMERYFNLEDRQKLYQKLVETNLLDTGKVPLDKFLPPLLTDPKSSYSFLVSPGSGYQSHHSYPGGLSTHTALNLKVSLALAEGYEGVYGAKVNRDVVIASQALHDLLKPWVFQWQANRSSRTELPLAGTGEHHSLSVAESLIRGLPAEVCVAQACAHEHPGDRIQEKQVVGWLKTAALIADQDPIKTGLLDSSGETLPQPRHLEGFFCHLGDHDYVLTVPMAQWLIPVMGKIAKEQYGLSEGELKGSQFNAFRNYVFSQFTIEYLYFQYASGGEGVLIDLIKRCVKA